VLPAHDGTTAALKVLRVGIVCSWHFAKLHGNGIGIRLLCCPRCFESPKSLCSTQLPQLPLQGQAAMYMLHHTHCSTLGWLHVPEPIEMHNRFPCVLHPQLQLGHRMFLTVVAGTEHWTSCQLSMRLYVQLTTRPWLQQLQQGVARPEGMLEQVGRGQKYKGEEASCVCLRWHAS
jgi:hypothetical protein